MLAMSFSVLAELSSPSGADAFRADRVVLEVPKGGMTQAGPPGSESTFRHRLLDVTVTALVASVELHKSWKVRCSPAGINAAAFQTGTLARTDQYLYSTISRDSRYGISTPKGSWLEHCLVIRSGELAAMISVVHPKSVLEKGEITAAAIEKVLASVRLTAAPIENRGTGDPRLVLALPDDFAPSGLPTFQFSFRHNRLPLTLNVTLSDPGDYDTAKLLNKMSARPWQVGKLARTDDHYYYFVWPDNLPAFVCR